MKTILIINSGINYALSGGELNTTLSNEAEKFAQELGFKTLRTDLAKGYELNEEIEKLKQADIWLWQSPAWWMSTPWQLKKYFDEVFTLSQGALYAKALKEPKHYMLSFTFELALKEFQGGFLGGANIDDLAIWLHKSFEFLGHKALKTFMCNEVRSKPNIPAFTQALKEHLSAELAQFSK